MDTIEELSIYEYWTTKEIWPLWRAVDFIVFYYLYMRSWNIAAFPMLDALEGGVRDQFK